MDKTITNLPVYRETRFRQPSPLERRLGLWVDRIGTGAGELNVRPRLRILGQYAVVAVESGGGEFVTAGRGRGTLQAGDVLFLQPAEPAAYGTRDTWFTRWVVWNGPEARMLADLDACFAEPVLHQTAAIVQRYFMELARWIDREDAAAALARKSILLAMWSDFLRHRTHTDPHAAAMAEITDHIGRHLESELPVADLAFRAHLSVPHFRRLFKRHTGSGPKAFIAAQRVARAKSMLVHGTPIKVVAQRVGYDDPAYFMRVFRAIAGEPPGKFARRTGG